MNQPCVLQLCPFSPYLESELAQRAQVIGWHLLSAVQQQDLLATRGGEIRAVVSGGHLGCPTALADALPGLGLIAINGVGFDKVDLPHAAARGIAVSTTPGTLTEDVADLAVGLTIGLLRQLPAADQHVRNGDWEQGERPLARKVSGRRFGIVGFGQIGLAIARRLAPFGPVAYTDPRPRPDLPFAYHADLLTLAAASDVLLLACSATPENRGFIGAQVFAALGAEGYLVNVARGSVVDEVALITALEQGIIAGAALDVFADEPHVPAALRASDKVMITPHIASATVETRKAMADLLLANLDAFLAGQALPSPISLR